MDNPEQFILKWNDFQSNMSSSFQGLLEEGSLLDVTLGAGGHFLQAHKLILSVCSSYFKQLFMINPCKHPIVILKDVEIKELKCLLEFMYKGEVNVSQEDLTSFLKTAEMLQITGLTRLSNNSGIPKGAGSMSNQTNVPKNIPRDTIPTKRQNVDAVEPSKSPPPLKRYCPEPSSICATSPKVEQDICQFKNEPVDIEIIDDDDEDDDGEDQESSNENNFNALPANESCSMMKHEGISESVIDQKNFRNNPEASEYWQSQQINGIPQECTQGKVYFVNTKMGNHQLVYNGYTYNKNYSHQNKISWRCSGYRKHGCLARCKSSDNFQFVYSRKGFQQLVMDGYIYRRHKIFETKTLWACTKYENIGCKARCHTFKDGFILKGSHNHSQQHAEILEKQKRGHIFSLVV